VRDLRYLELIEALAEAGKGRRKSAVMTAAAAARDSGSAAPPSEGLADYLAFQVR